LTGELLYAAVKSLVIFVENKTPTFEVTFFEKSFSLSKKDSKKSSPSPFSQQKSTILKKFCPLF
jgi:hypothetical protein